MVLELDRRFPGLGRQIDESIAVAIDGEIYQDAYLAPLNPNSDIYLIPRSASFSVSLNPDAASGRKDMWLTTRENGASSLIANAHVPSLRGGRK